MQRRFDCDATTCSVYLIKIYHACKSCLLDSHTQSEKQNANFKVQCKKSARNIEDK